METEKSTQNNESPTVSTSAPTQPVSAQPTQTQSEYRGWLNSNSFLKRAFAIWGYYFVANFIISTVVFIATFVIFAMIGLSLLSVLAPKWENLNSNNPTSSLENFLGSFEQED